MQTGFIQKLTEIVEANLSNENFGIDDLAKEMGMNRISLYRKFKSTTNQTGNQFIRELRLKKAKELLINEDLTVAEVSYRVGFSSPTYFSNCFHKYFGVTPGEMKNHEQETESFEHPVEASPKKFKSSKIVMVLVVSIIVLLPLVYFLLNKYPVFKTVDAKEKSIAVLPFINLSNDTLNQYQANAMMDAILMNLSKIKDLRVISRTSVEQYRGSKKTIAEIGRELDVAYLLEGSFQKVDNQIRLIIQLIRAKDEDHVLSKSYDRKWEDIFSTQSEVAEKVAGELQVAITPEEKQLIRKVPTLNLTAFDFYQKGNEEYYNYLFEGSANFSRILNAEKYFLKALELDSTFAQGYSGMAMTYYYRNRGKNFFSGNYLDSMLLLANKALSLDDQLAEAIRIRGNYYFETGNQSQALKEYEKVLRLNPNDWRTFANLSLLNKSFGDYVSAISNLHEAIIRNRGPELGFLLASLGAAYQNAGFIEKAKQCYEEILALNNDSSGYIGRILWLDYEIGSYEEAYNLEFYFEPNNPAFIGNLTLSILAGHDEVSYFRAVKKIEWHKKYGGIPLVESHRIGYALLKAGKKEEAEYYFDQQIKYGLESITLGRSNSKDKTAFYDLAAAYALKGEKGKAYQYLAEMNKKKTHPLLAINLIKRDPLFNSMRDEPQFQAIIKDMESKYQAEHDRVAKWLEEQGML